MRCIQPNPVLLQDYPMPYCVGQPLGFLRIGIGCYKTSSMIGAFLLWNNECMVLRSSGKEIYDLVSVFPPVRQGSARMRRTSVKNLYCDVAYLQGEFDVSYIEASPTRITLLWGVWGMPRCATLSLAPREKFFAPSCIDWVPIHQCRPRQASMWISRSRSTMPVLLREVASAAYTSEVGRLHDKQVMEPDHLASPPSAFPIDEL